MADCFKSERWKVLWILSEAFRDNLQLLYLNLIYLWREINRAKSKLQQNSHVDHRPLNSDASFPGRSSPARPPNNQVVLRLHFSLGLYLAPVALPEAASAIKSSWLSLYVLRFLARPSKSPAGIPAPHSPRSKNPA